MFFCSRESKSVFLLPRGENGDDYWSTPTPPIQDLLGMWLAEASEGRVVFAIEPAEYHYNPSCVVHGGIAATLLDSAMGCAIVSMLPAATRLTTLELKANFLRPITSKTGVVSTAAQIYRQTWTLVVSAALSQSGLSAFLPVSDRLVAQESLLRQSAGWNVAASSQREAPPHSHVCSSADLAWPAFIGVSLQQAFPARSLAEQGVDPPHPLGTGEGGGFFFGCQCDSRKKEWCILTEAL